VEIDEEIFEGKAKEAPGATNEVYEAFYTFRPLEKFMSESPIYSTHILNKYIYYFNK